MAVALEGVDLAALLVCLVAIALLTLALAMLRPILDGLNKVTGWIPLVGGGVKYVDDAIVDALELALAGAKYDAQALFNGLVWLNKLMAEAVHSVATLAEQAFHYLTETTIPRAIEAELGGVRDLAHDASLAAAKAETDVADAREWAGGWIDYLTNQVATVIPQEIAAKVDQVGVDLGAVVGQVEDALLDRLGTLRGDTTAIETQLADAIGKIRGQVEGIDLTAVTATAAGAAAAIELLARETGLDNPSCRSKVKGICGVNPLRWEKLIAGLVLAAEWPGLEAFAEGIADFVPDVVDAVEALATA